MLAVMVPDFGGPGCSLVLITRPNSYFPFNPCPWHALHLTVHPSCAHEPQHHLSYIHSLTGWYEHVVVLLLWPPGQLLLYTTPMHFSSAVGSWEGEWLKEHLQVNRQGKAQRQTVEEVHTFVCWVSSSGCSTRLNEGLKRDGQNRIPLSLSVHALSDG